MPRGPKPTPVTVPEWFKRLRDDAELNAKEVCELAGLHISFAYKAVERGELPPPDKVRKSRFARSAPKRYWTVAQIKQWLRESGRVQQEQ